MKFINPKAQAVAHERSEGVVSRCQTNTRQALIDILIISAGCNWSGDNTTHYQFSSAAFGAQAISINGARIRGNLPLFDDEEPLFLRNCSGE